MHEHRNLGLGHILVLRLLSGYIDTMSCVTCRSPLLFKLYFMRTSPPWVFRVRSAGGIGKSDSQCCAVAVGTQAPKLGNQRSQISLERSLCGFLSAPGFVTSLLSLQHCPVGTAQGTCSFWKILVLSLFGLLLALPALIDPQLLLLPCSGNCFRSSLGRGTRCSLPLLDLFGTSCFLISVLWGCSKLPAGHR